MTPAYFYAIAAMACFGLADLTYKRAASVGIQSHQFLFGQTWLFTPVVFALAWATSAPVFEPAALWGSAAGACAFIGFYNFAQSLKHGSVSINAPIFRLSFTLTAALAIMFLNEPLSPLKAAGLMLAFAAVVLLLGASAAPNARRNSRAAVVHVLIATIATGVGNLLYKVGLAAGSTPFALLAAQAVVFMPLAAVMVAKAEGTLRLPTRTIAYSIPAAAGLVSGFLFMLSALQRGHASVLVPIAQMGFVFTALLGFALYREPMTVRKGIGLAAALAALAAFAAS